MAKNPGFLKTLVIVGCILAIIGTVFQFSPSAWIIISGIIDIILAVLMLATKGVIPLKKKILPDMWIVTLIVGIVFVALIYGWAYLCVVGGILLIVSALLDKFT